MIRTCVITQFLLILLLNLGALNVHQGFTLACHQAEREALLKFRHSFSDRSNSLPSWKGKGGCDWEGVSCDNVTALVIRLDLHNTLCDYHFSPTFSPKLDPSLLELSHLNYLDLSCLNFLESQIPKFIGDFKHLRYLNLSYSHFGDIVPSQLTNLTRLLTLDLSGNSDLSSDLHWISSMVSLQYLDFGGNYIVDSNNSMDALNIPPSLLALHLKECQNLDNPSLSLLFSNSRIQYLDISGNFLGGRLAYFMANMTSVRYLDASANFLTGSFPVWLRNMTSLTHLDLSSNQLNCLIPLRLGNMASLTHLDLSYNQLDGSIPLWLGNMTSLTHLDLSANNLNGPVQTWLGNMIALRNLDLSYNILNGSIPLSMRNMRKLEYLDLSYNSFSGVEGGTIMGILGNLCKLINFDLSDNSIGASIEGSHKNVSKCINYDLENLWLSQNMIGGMLPSWLGDFKHLRELDLKNNNINGHIPISIQSLSYLENLDLSFNTLNGTLPQELGQCKSLVQIDLSSNLLHGALSESHLENLSKLDYLDLRFNVMEWNISSNWSPSFQIAWLLMASCKIKSEFPRWVGDQTNLYRVDFSDNEIFGELPRCFSSDILGNINISHNQITGPLPHFKSSLDTIDFSYNMLSGSLLYHDPLAKNDTSVGPPICLPIGNLGSLEFINLQKNNISGVIPGFLAESDLLYYINLASNNFSGIIPFSIGLLTSLKFLKLSENSLDGPFPPSLCNILTLEFLDLGDNKLVGNIPSNWRNDTSLELLRLRGNQLVGSIPPTLCSIHTLQFIDLSLNNLVGAIPRCFGHLPRMKSGGPAYDSFTLDEEDSAIMVILKGAVLEYTRTLKYVINLDLSSNALTGIIPEEITNLSALIGLNLSHNHLTGNIPNKIGEMRSLESLDISNNDLSGTIPQSISALTSLVSLNLSYNKLQGEIPTGPQLQVIKDPSMTYIGNPGLCGDPLPNKCRTDHGENQPIQGQEKPGKVDVWDKPLLYLVIMSGFATGFWGIVGSLLLNTRFRFAFFQAIGNVVDYLYVQVMIRLNRLTNQH